MGADMLTPPGLAFAARQWSDRTCPVTDENGALAATIVPATFGNRFVARDAYGYPLCSGRKVLLSGWVAVDADGAELVRLQPGRLASSSASLRGGSLVASICERFLSRTWGLQLADGRMLLESVHDARGWNVLRDAWLVRTDGTLTLAEIVAVVELQRLELRRRRNSG